MLPLSEIPISVLAFFVGFLGLTALGIRSFIRYRTLKTPLVYYFGLTGLGFGSGLFFYSVPFMLTQSEPWLKTALIIGDACILAALVVQAQTLWYLQFHQVIKNRLYLLIPVALLALIVWIINATYSVLVATVAVRDRMVIYELPSIGLYLLALLYLILLAEGVYFIRESFQVAGASARLRSLSLGTLFTLGGIASIYSTLFSQGLISELAAVTFLLIFVVFLATIIVINTRLTKSPTQ